MYAIADSAFKRMQVDARACQLDTDEHHRGLALRTSGRSIATNGMTGDTQTAPRHSVQCELNVILAQIIWLSLPFSRPAIYSGFTSAMALSSLTRVLPRWKAWADTARGIEVLKTADYPFPEPNAMFIGAVIQKYRPRSGAASKAFQHWIDQLVAGLKDQLVPALVKAETLTTSKPEAGLSRGTRSWRSPTSIPSSHSLKSIRCPFTH
jgi:hypothetical protein